MMRKAVANGNLPGKEASGRRYWMRANPLAAPLAGKAAPTEGAGKRPPKARFLEPYRLSEERRAALIRLLAEGGVGDGESHELFASAIEYDIANARQALTREAPAAAEEPPKSAAATQPASEAAPGPTQAPPADLGCAARSLAEQIAGLDEPLRAAIAESLQGQDPFRRSYDGAYLDALCLELTRLADAVAGQGQPPPAEMAPVPAPPAVDPPLGEAARRFLRRVARVYEEVLESRAEPQSGGTFEAVLGLVSEEAGVALPRDPARLSEAFREP